MLLDVNYLCYRAFYSSGYLSHGDVKTGVIYGLLRSLVAFKDEHNTSRFLFCFDHGLNKRKGIDRDYKANRRQNSTPEEKQLHQEMEEQIQALKHVYLKQIGFKNVFYQDGYEADDIIAKLCKNVPNTHRVIIVSSDHDLFQCLKHNVEMWNPKEKKFYTTEYLRRTLGVHPDMWHMVKAIAGCSSDNIKGIERVGEATAIKYLNGQLKIDSKAYQAIESGEGEKIIAHNLKLTKLPLKGLVRPRIRKNDFSTQGWKDLLKELGIMSMPKRNPFAKGKKYGIKKKNRRGRPKGS